ncbi:MAG TPA: PaaX family transcriptional regulator C-terminal domain-containing protein [Pseudonocardiaceae bacterium]|nr:PaaX family transcriptional regulator C-terminal domain-containing protein [Pseudonocardiaceae bacterium]
MPTPQSVLMTMLGRYCAEENPPIATAGYIDVLGRIDVSEHATRLTVTRMTERGLLERVKRGRVAYFRATEVALNVVRNQDTRTFAGPADSPGADGVWTILSFSMPESQRNERHLLRRRLAWEGFGLLRDGVWIAPGDRDVTAMVKQLLGTDPDAAGRQIEAFTAYPKFTDIHGMISRTWKLAELAERYQQFLREWDVPTPAPEAVDDLGRDLLLITTWRQLLRATPQLPGRHLPSGWPADRCHDLFGALHARYEAEAARLFTELLTHNTG